MVGRNPLEVVGRGVRPDAAEELPDLPFPALEVGAEDRDLVGVRHLHGANPLTPAAAQEVGLACHSQVANPLRVPARRDEVALALEVKDVDRDAARLAGLPTAHLEDA